MPRNCGNGNSKGATLPPSIREGSTSKSESTDHSGRSRLFMDVVLIKSAVNRTDALAHVLQLPCTSSALSIDLEWIMSIHEQCGHPGIKRMLYFYEHG